MLKIRYTHESAAHVIDVPGIAPHNVRLRRVDGLPTAEVRETDADERAEVCDKPYAAAWLGWTRGQCPSYGSTPEGAVRALAAGKLTLPALIEPTPHRPTLAEAARYLAGALARAGLRVRHHEGGDAFDVEVSGVRFAVAVHETGENTAPLPEGAPLTLDDVRNIRSDVFDVLGALDNLLAGTDDPEGELREIESAGTALAGCAARLLGGE